MGTDGDLEGRFSLQNHACLLKVPAENGGEGRIAWSTGARCRHGPRTLGKAQCRSTHKAIAIELFAKIVELKRCIKTVLLSQKNGLQKQMLSNKTACKFANSETVNLDKNPESHNSSDERLGTLEPSHPSEKASEKLICHWIMMRLFLKKSTHIKKRFPLFGGAWGSVDEGIFFP